MGIFEDALVLLGFNGKVAAQPVKVLGKCTTPEARVPAGVLSLLPEDVHQERKLVEQVRRAGRRQSGYALTEGPSNVICGRTASHFFPAQVYQGELGAAAQVGDVRGSTRWQDAAGREGAT